MTRAIKIGNVTIGSGNPVAIQSMLNRRADDIEGNVSQAVRLQQAGCDINRVAIPDENALVLIPEIKAATNIPLVADIHFDYRLAIKSVEKGADKIRFNPGNIGNDKKVKAVVDCCRERDIPIRVGVNSGSVEKDLLTKHGSPKAAALVESAMRHVRLIESYGYNNIVISIKSSTVQTMVESYRLVAGLCDYPLHLGVTEAGTKEIGTVKSAIGIGSLLLDGIGDTIRVSLTDDPVCEITAAKVILKSLGMQRGVQVISCPTCGRTDIDIISIAREVENATSDIDKHIKIAVMGCVVNGPGEAKEADIGIAGGKNSAVIFKNGKVLRRITGNYVEELLNEIKSLN